MEIAGTSYRVFTRRKATECLQRRNTCKAAHASQQCGRSSAGRAPPCQGGCREFESRRPLARHCQARILRNPAYTVGWPRGEAAACKAVYTGSNPVPTSVKTMVFRIPSESAWAIGAAVARFPDTEEVTGSIPVSPTAESPGPEGPGLLTFRDQHLDRP